MKGTWRVGGRVQGDRRHSAVAAGDRVLMRMLMMRMMAGERLRLLVRRIISVKRFVACHQRIQHLEHHFRRRNDVGAAIAAAAATAGRQRADVAAVCIRVDYYARRLPRRPRRPDAYDARRDVAFDCPARRRRWSLLDDGESSIRATTIQFSTRFCTIRCWRTLRVSARCAWRDEQTLQSRRQ